MLSAQAILRGPAARILLTSELRHPRAAQAARVLREAARDALAALGLRGCELSVALVSDRTIRRLNRYWRGKDRPTDVLSFPQGGTKASPGPIGDVVISLHTALRQAEEGGWGLSRELRRLLAHGLLHCLGHDHETPAGARRMARAEQRLLGREGMVGAALSDAGPKEPRRRPLRARVEGQAPRRSRAPPRKRP